MGRDCPRQLGAAGHAGRRGHGLAIAARVAARHGGRLVCAPVTAGACLVIELPPAGAVAHRARRRSVAADRR